MSFIPVIALLIGLVIGLSVGQPIRGEIGTYYALACLAALDSICGGIRSGLESKFHTDIFLTGFLSNIVIAAFLAWLGDKIGLNLFLAVALILGGRVFTNLSLIRRYMITIWHDSRARRTQQQPSQPVSAQQVTPP